MVGNRVRRACVKGKGNNCKRQEDSGSPSILGIAEFIVPTGSFFHAQTHVSFPIIEELSPNVRVIP